MARRKIGAGLVAARFDEAFAVLAAKAGSVCASVTSAAITRPYGRWLASRAQGRSSASRSPRSEPVSRAAGRAAAHSVVQRVQGERFLGGPPAVDGGLADPGPLGDRVHADRVRPRASRSSAAASRIALRAFSLRGRPRRCAGVLASGVMRRVRVALGPRRACQSERRDVAVPVAERRRRREPFVGERGRGQRDVLLAAGLEREPDVLVHQLDIEPCLLGQVEDEGGAACSIGDPIAVPVIASSGQLRVDAAALGQQHPLAEGEHLCGEADVDGQLEQQALAVPADVGDAAAQLGATAVPPPGRPRPGRPP